MKLKEICKECVHRRECSLPCRPVELHLAEGNRQLYERTYIDRATGRHMTVIYSNARQGDREIRRSSLEDGERPEEYARTFSTECENPFAGFSPQLKLTGIFIDRIIRKMSIDDLVVKYDLKDRRDAHGRLRAMTARIFDILRYMEQRTARKSVALQRMEKIASLPKKHQWFLMARILNMHPAEIAEMEGVKNVESIRRSIRDVHDQIAAGEKDLILFTPEQRRSATSRLKKRRRLEKKRSARRRMRRKNNQES